MGFLIALALLTLTAVLLWKAFGPSDLAALRRDPANRTPRQQRRPVLGPDDDPDFLHGLNKPD